MRDLQVCCGKMSNFRLGNNVSSFAYQCGQYTVTGRTIKYSSTRWKQVMNEPAYLSAAAKILDRQWSAFLVIFDYKIVLRMIVEQ